MKRIIFCFDGTSNRIDSEFGTNVLLTASCITPQTQEGVTQIIHYDNGVGTEKNDKMAGGLFGIGLFKNVSEAYQFLIFNYTPGDEVFAFGFSRGAYTARSFVGFVKNTGIIERQYAYKIKDAIELYKNRKKKNLFDFFEFRKQYSSHICTSIEEDQWRCEHHPQDYSAGQADMFQFKYVGVWDTVESLGKWKVTRTFIPFLRNRPYFDPEYSFHDHDLSTLVASARHAVAVDERRRAFDVTPWDNLDKLNKDLGFKPDDPHAPYQQKFFPGTHGSVGGGGFITGLSDGTLEWIWEGAKSAGLTFDASPASRIFELKPDYRVPLDNWNPEKPRKGSAKFLNNLPARTRTFRPKALHEIHDSAVRRWRHQNADEITDGKYGLADQINMVEAKPFVEVKKERGLIQAPKPTQEMQLYTVVKGDYLSKIAKKLLGDAKRYPEIFEANQHIISDPDKIYIGQTLKVPMK